MRNVCGLISGNLKRHLRSRHAVVMERVERQGVAVSDQHGPDLVRLAVVGCDVCGRHVEALESAMGRW